jgi:membrane protease YdiL (CAAX protease family)
MQPSIIDNILVLLFGVALPWFSGVRGKQQLQTIAFTPAVRKQFYLSNSVVMSFLALFTMGIWMIQHRHLSDLGFRAMQKGIYYWITAILLVILFIVESIYTRSTSKKRRNKPDLDAAVPFLPKSYSELPAYTLMCISAGLGEEILYRGFMVTYFIDPSIVRFPWLALFLPAMLFSLAHYYQGYMAVLKIFVLSILFALIFIWSGSLILPIIIHFLIDFIGGWMAIHQSEVN